MLVKWSDDLLQHHDAEAVQGRAFTPHDALLRGVLEVARCRWPRGSAPRPKGAAGVRRRATTAAAASGRTSRSACSRKRFGSDGLDPLHARDRRESARQAPALPLRPRPGSRRRAPRGRAPPPCPMSAMLPSLNKCDAVANALHPIEQMRGQQHAHAVLLELADDIEQLDRRLRIETRGRLVEDRDLRVLHQDFGKRRAAGACRARRSAPRLSMTSEQPDMLERGVDLAPRARRARDRSSRAV